MPLYYLISSSLKLSSLSLFYSSSYLDSSSLITFELLKNAFIKLLSALDYPNEINRGVLFNLSFLHNFFQNSIFTIYLISFKSIAYFI
jgi:hypothetical protein